MKLIKILIWGILVIVAVIFIIYFLLDNSQESLKVENLRSNATGEYISLSKGKVRYEFIGSPESELVVLIHGGGSTGCYVWKKTVPALTKAGYRVLCYDLYGRGFSDSPDATYNPELLYTQFEELLDSLNIEQPFDIIGQSMGAMVATHFSSNYPDKIKNLVYVAPANLGAYTEQWYLKTPFISDLLMTAYWYPRTINNQMNEFYRQENHQDYKEQLAYFTKIKGYKRVNLSTWLNTLTVNLENELKRIGEQGTSVLLIMGKNDPLIPVESKTHYEKAIPNLKLKIIEEAGHMPHFEQPQLVNDIIVDFLNQ